MYKHILIPTDGSALSEEAIRQGVAFAKSINATVTAVTVAPSFHTVSNAIWHSLGRSPGLRGCRARVPTW